MIPVTVTFIHPSSGCIATLTPVFRDGEFSFDLTVNGPADLDHDLGLCFYSTWTAWLSEVMTTKKQPSLPLGWLRQS